jgi:RNA polymerase sigma factor (TIGR02999 family)
VSARLTDRPAAADSPSREIKRPTAPQKCEAGENPQNEPNATMKADIPTHLADSLTAAAGSRERLDALLAELYDDLRRLAGRYMGQERAGHTLQATAIVHEAYMRLAAQHATQWADRTQFFALASQMIRRILVDHARSRDAEKRGGGAAPLTLHEPAVDVGADPIDLLALDEALCRLSDIDPKQTQIVELRYFGGLSVDEVARILDKGKRSVDRDWAFAKAWLHRELTK